MITRILLMAFAITALEACTGNGHQSGTGIAPGTTLTHEQLANEFMRRVNIDVNNWINHMDLVKLNTLQGGEWVVLKDNFGAFYAFDLSLYQLGENAGDFMQRVQEGAGTYYVYRVDDNLYASRNNNTGNYQVYFSKTEGTTKNLAKLKAFKESLVINSSAEQLRLNYGMSVEKSVDAARFAYRMQTSGIGTYNVKDYDAFAKELTGSTITDFQKDISAGNMASLQQRIDMASQVTGMGSEGVNKLIKEFNQH